MTGLALTATFPLLALLFSVFAWFFPFLFIPFKSAIIPMLSIIMLSMGLTLTWNQFREVVRSPKVIVLGVAMQFSIMPFSALMIGKLLNLPFPFIIGMVLVGSSPGGTASNVICYLSNADVALSITLTLASTLLSVAATPLLSWIYLNESVAVPVGKMLISVVQIVLIPVLTGTTINTLSGQWLRRIQKIFPWIAMLTVVFIIAIILAINSAQLHEGGWLVVLAVILHNSAGLASGYGIARLFRLDKKTARTLSIEVGMQNSGLGVALAVKYFSGLAAIPGAIFSIWHNLSGSILSGYWRSKNMRIKMTD